MILRHITYLLAIAAVGLVSCRPNEISYQNAEGYTLVRQTKGPDLGVTVLLL